jgi:hypothetical protein
VAANGHWGLVQHGGETAAVKGTLPRRLQVGIWAGWLYSHIASFRDQTALLLFQVIISSPKVLA